MRDTAAGKATRNHAVPAGSSYLKRTRSVVVMAPSFVVGAVKCDPSRVEVNIW